MNILLTAVGKRVQLIKHLKKSNYVVGVDSGDLASAKYFVDSFYKVSKCDDNSYVDELLDICKKEDINMLIPLFEKEFSTLCDSRERFHEIGVYLLLSHKNIIDICNNKWNTHLFFTNYNIDTPKSFLGADVKKNLYFGNKSLIAKPLVGMGSKGIIKINNCKELRFYSQYINQYIVQEIIEGVEYTIDVLCDLHGSIISVVPRERIEVRDGEVSKAKTVKNDKLIQATMELCQKLKMAAETDMLIGPLTMQAIITKDNDIKFIEINPRFGGGVPLTFEAGVNYGRYFNEMIEGEKIKPIIGEFKKITMLRYDEAVFI